MTKKPRPKASQAAPAQRSEAKAADKGDDAGQGENAAQGCSGAAEAGSTPHRSLQNDDPIGEDFLRAELGSCLDYMGGVDRAEWLDLCLADESYQRDKMKKPLAKLVKVLDQLSALERKRPFRVRGDELLEESLQHFRRSKVCLGYEDADGNIPRLPEPELPAPEGPTFTQLADEVRWRLRYIPKAKRGRRAEFVRDVEHDELDRLFGTKEADRILVPEARKNRESRLEVVQRARSKRAKRMLGDVQRYLERSGERSSSKIWKRKRKEALSEVVRCDTSLENMGNLVTRLTELGFGNSIAVIDLGRYVQALGQRK